MSSYHRSLCLQKSQWERPFITSSPFGKRSAKTFKNDPTHTPITNKNKPIDEYSIEECATGTQDSDRFIPENHRWYTA